MGKRLYEKKVSLKGLLVIRIVRQAHVVKTVVISLLKKVISKVFSKQVIDHISQLFLLETEIKVEYESLRRDWILSPDC